ncbi:MAG: insulinase family protein [Pseudomonadales bacterium]|nr:insulinase family protein [Pseudomonadales bacterium]
MTNLPHFRLTNWFFKTLFSALFALLITSNGYASAFNNTHEYTLSNGLKLIVKEDHRAPIFVSQLWYGIGSSHETTGMTGVSHVLEHMMFKGTTKTKAGEFAELISRYGGTHNAFTTRDHTGYYQLMPNDRLELILELEADRMQNLRIDEEQFQRELKVVMEERRQRTDDRPTSLAYEHFTAVAFAGSGYSHPVIGWMKDIEGLTAKQAMDWYKLWYAPNNAVLVIVGDLDPKQVYAQVQRHFGSIPRIEFPQNKPITGLGYRSGQRRIEMKLKTRLPHLFLGFRAPNVITAEHPWEPYALELLVGVLDGGFSARIEKELVRGTEVASSAGAGYNLHSRGDSLITISGTPNLQKGFTLDDLENALIAQLDRFKTEPVSELELARVRTQLIAAQVFSQDSISAQASRIGKIESLGRSWRSLENDTAQLQAVTTEQIQQVAQKYLTSDALTALRLLPIKTATTQPLSHSSL